jgi:hypothetical protein
MKIVIDPNVFVPLVFGAPLARSHSFGLRDGSRFASPSRS